MRLGCQVAAHVCKKVLGFSAGFVSCVLRFKLAKELRFALRTTRLAENVFWNISSWAKSKKAHPKHAPTRVS